MPAEHPLLIKGVSKVSRKAVDDMPRRNDLLANKSVIASIQHELNPASPSLVFGKIFGDTPDKDPDMIQVSMEGIGSEFYRMRKYKKQRQHARVVDVSKVPDKLVAGDGKTMTTNNFVITTDRFVGDPGSKLLHPNGQTVFMVTNYRVSSDRLYEVTMQLNDVPGTVVPGGILQPDMILNFGMSNSVGEGSLHGNTLIDQGQAYYDKMNSFQISRYDLTQTGSAAADTTFKFLAEEDINGVKQQLEFITDLPMWAAKEVLMQLDRDIMLSRPNFNWDQYIANRADTTRYPERPTFAGLYWWMDNCPKHWRVSKRDSLVKGVKLLEYMANYGKNTLGVQTKRWVVFAQGAGREWVKDVMDKAVEMKNYQLNLTVQDKLKVGFEVDEYYTRHGIITVVDLGQGMAGWGWGEWNMQNYGGIGYGPRTNYLYFAPAVNRDQQKQAKILYKEGNGYSRALVVGTSKGITGSLGGMTADQISSMTDAGIQRMLANERIRLDTTADINSTHFLSHISAYMDCDLMQRIELIP
jgi:hypothetical protein